MARRKADSSQSLFPSRTPLGQPLADRMRPRTLDEIVGQEHLLGPEKFLRQMVSAHVLHSMILWGPPGTGKTTLALVLAEAIGAVFRKLAAVTSGVADLREAVEAARQDLDAGKRTVVFIDEIHRWNRAQQDAFLPHVESGLITLIGATTENPSLKSSRRCSRGCGCSYCIRSRRKTSRRWCIARSPTSERGLGGLGLKLGVGAIDEIVRYADGDARRALGTLEIAAEFAQNAGATLIAPEHIREVGAAEGAALRSRRRGALQRYLGLHQKHARQRSRRRDLLDDADGRGGRGSAVHRAADGRVRVRRRRQRRSARAANSDRGQGGGGLRRDAGRGDSARPRRDVSGQCAQVERRVSCDASGGRDAKTLGALPVPLHLRNAPTPMMKGLGYGKDYRYPHDFEGALVAQSYLPDELEEKIYYEPSQRGYEIRIREFCPRARETQHRIAAQARRERLTGQKRPREPDRVRSRGSQKSGQEIIWRRAPKSFSALAAVKRNLRAPES